MLFLLFFGSFWVSVCVYESAHQEAQGQRDAVYTLATREQRLSAATLFLLHSLSLSLFDRLPPDFGCKDLLRRE